MLKHKLINYTCIWIFFSPKPVNVDVVIWYVVLYITCLEEWLEQIGQYYWCLVHISFSQTCIYYFFSNRHILYNKSNHILHPCPWTVTYIFNRHILYSKSNGMICVYVHGLLHIMFKYIYIFFKSTHFI